STPHDLGGHTHIVSNPPTGLALPPSPTMTIHEWCAMQDPFTLIGGYVQLDDHGMCCCPFGWHHDDGRDAHPSFRVYAPRSAGCRRQPVRCGRGASNTRP